MIPYKKLSKKEKRKLDAAKRNSGLRAGRGE